MVVTAQYVLKLNPQPFVFEAADVNEDHNITVADVSRIAWMVANPTLAAPLLRVPALWNNGDRISANDITLAGQQMDRPQSGVTLVVTTYTDGTRTATKLIR